MEQDQYYELSLLYDLSLRVDPLVTELKWHLTNIISLSGQQINSSRATGFSDAVKLGERSRECYVGGFALDGRRSRDESEIRQRLSSRD